MLFWNVLWSTVLIFGVRPVAAPAAANSAANAAFGTASEPLEPMVTVPVAADGLAGLLAEDEHAASAPGTVASPAATPKPLSRLRRPTGWRYGEFCGADIVCSPRSEGFVTRTKQE